MFGETAKKNMALSVPEQETTIRNYVIGFGTCGGITLLAILLSKDAPWRNKNAPSKSSRSVVGSAKILPGGLAQTTAPEGVTESSTNQTSANATQPIYSPRIEEQSNISHASRSVNISAPEVHKTKTQQPVPAPSIVSKPRASAVVDYGSALNDTANIKSSAIPYTESSSLVNVHTEHSLIQPIIRNSELPSISQAMHTKRKLKVSVAKHGALYVERLPQSPGKS